MNIIPSLLFGITLFTSVTGNNIANNPITFTEGFFFNTSVISLATELKQKENKTDITKFAIRISIKETFSASIGNIQLSGITNTLKNPVPSFLSPLGSYSNENKITFSLPTESSGTKKIHGGISFGNYKTESTNFLTGFHITSFISDISTNLPPKNVFFNFGLQFSLPLRFTLTYNFTFGNSFVESKTSKNWFLSKQFFPQTSVHTGLQNIILSYKNANNAFLLKSCFLIQNNPLGGLSFSNSLYTTIKNKYFTLNAHGFINSIDFIGISGILVRETVKILCNPQFTIYLSEKNNSIIKFGFSGETSYSHTEEQLPASIWYYNLGAEIFFSSTLFAIKGCSVCKKISYPQSNEILSIENQVTFDFAQINQSIEHTFSPLQEKVIHTIKLETELFSKDRKYSCSFSETISESIITNCKLKLKTKFSYFLFQTELEISKEKTKWEISVRYN